MTTVSTHDITSCRTHYFLFSLVDSATPTPATPTSSKPKISSVTAIVRTFFENMSSKQRKLHTQDSRNDSGIQVGGSNSGRGTF